MKTQEFKTKFDLLAKEISREVVGYQEIIADVLTGLFAGGNILLEAAPGLGKTLIGKTLARALNIKYARIQFTPDLMPADIVGTNIIVEDSTGKKEIVFQRGPVFTNLLLADEINRATPKTQSALLEAMQEHQVTVAGKTYKLEEPFLVVATQNPEETEGVYRLPEAQIDRFLFRLKLQALSDQEWIEISRRRTGILEIKMEQAITKQDISDMQVAVRSVKVPEEVCAYGAELVESSHPGSAKAPALVKKYVRIGSSPRGLQAMLLGAKVRALANGRDSITLEDLRSVALPALSHRLLFNFEGQADKVKPEAVVKEILDKSGKGA
ncbi:MAG: MoxR family ATPase [Candidatus Firestonebacteria bacterium]